MCVSNAPIFKRRFIVLFCSLGAETGHGRATVWKKIVIVAARGTVEVTERLFITFSRSRDVSWRGACPFAMRMAGNAPANPQIAGRFFVKLSRDFLLWNCG